MVEQAEPVRFRGGNGVELDGRLERPAGPVRAYALFAHCFTCSKDLFAARWIAAGLAGRGIATLRFDFAGLGRSGGDFADTTFSANVDDLVAAADHLRSGYGAPAVLVGHSLGGAAVLAAAERIPEARAVATVGAPADVGHVRHLLATAEAEIRAAGEAEISIGGRSFRLKRGFLDDLDGHRLAERIANLKRALLVLHAPRDEVVGIDNASAIFAAAKHPKSFVSLDDADHLLTRRADAEYVAHLIAAWASRYLPQGTPADLPAAGVVEVAEAGVGRFAQTVRVGRHALRADEPEAVGGDDTGPGPYDLLLAALGTCTSMTLRMYAERKGLALEHVAVHLAHSRVHAQDCADCEQREGRVEVIERTLHLRGDLSAAERARLVEIAGKCPVHRTLEGQVHIRTRLADA